MRYLCLWKFSGIFVVVVPQALRKQHLPSKWNMQYTHCIFYYISWWHIILSEISQWQKDKYYMVPPILGISNSQIQGIKGWNGGCEGLERGENEELLINGHKVSVEHDESSPPGWAALLVRASSWYTKIRVQSPVRAHTRINQWVPGWVEQQTDVSLSLSVSQSLPFFL